jgi:eukaryotic-like serine/threonine-protein kinase
MRPGWGRAWRLSSTCSASARAATVRCGGASARGDGAILAKKKLLVADADSICRFSREVRIQSRLDHPNIVKVIAQRLQTRPYWYVMPLYRRSLDDELRNPIGDEKRVKKIFGAILDGMEYAHKEGVLHRDLKPKNVLMNSDDDLAITDFGLGRMVDSESSRVTPTGEGMGTPLYVAPEQWDDLKTADVRSDIFTLRRMLYEFYTGRLTSSTQDLSQLPAGVAVIVGRCTQHDPARRY